MSGPPWSGALNLLKPPGMSSHDVVAFVRRLLKQRQVGHGGTLDPGAAGVLPVFLGAATRLIPFLSGADRVGSLCFGGGVDTG